MTTGKAAAYLGLSAKQFRRYQDSIPCVRRGKGWRYFWVHDLEAFRNKSATTPVIKQTISKPSAVVDDPSGWIDFGMCPRGRIEDG